MAGKYGKQHRNRQRRETEESFAAFQADSAWEPDDGEATVETTDTAYLDDDATLITQRVVAYVKNNLIVEFAVIVKTRNDDGQWVELLCIDTCNHGSVHRHVNGDHSKLEVIVEIDDQRTIQDGYWDAVGEAYDLAYNEGAAS